MDDDDLPINVWEIGESCEVRTETDTLLDLYNKYQDNDDEFEGLTRGLHVRQDKPKSAPVTILSHSKFEPVNRDRIVGLELVLDDVDRYSDVLSNLADFTEQGVEIPGGVIFVGERGLGKTLTARYLVTKSGAMFINLSEPAYVGVPLKQIYAQARQVVEKTGKPVILLLDEIEKRVKKDFGGDLNDTGIDLLEILDGIEGREKNKGIFLIGTANDFDRDGATAPLYRPGRLERIQFYAPTREQKVELIDLFTNRFVEKGKASGKQIEIDLGYNAEDLVELFSDDDSPALIESIVRDTYALAVVDAARTGEPIRLTPRKFCNTFMKRKLPEAVGGVKNSEDLKQTAIHEIGHYIVARKHGMDVPFVTVVPTLSALGTTRIEARTKSFPVERGKAVVAVLQGGHAACELAGYNISLNDADDVEKAKKLADQISQLENYMCICKDGVPQGKAPNLKDVLLASNDNGLYANRDVLYKAYQMATAAIKEVGKHNLEKLAEQLVEERTLFGKDLDIRIRALQAGNGDNQFAGPPTISAPMG